MFKKSKIDYDLLNNPVRIQFTNGNVTKYVYSATGEKLRVIYQTAVPNISVAMGSSRELAPSEIQFADSTDYLLGGVLTMKNGRIDKYLFGGGYAQASVASSTTDNFAFYYYNQDHLGNVREVVDASGAVKQVTNYYPFGAPYADTSAATNAEFQPYKYNGKELDLMHGLDTYDYGARQYNPILARWDRMDPLCEKYYSVSPYAYCGGNPVNAIDPNGKEVVIEGSYIQKLIMFSSLQLLTNDGLAMKENGEVYIESTGTRNLDKDLNVGTSLVSSMIDNKHTATLSLNNKEKNSTHPLSYTGSINGKGTDVQISIDPCAPANFLVNDEKTGESMMEQCPLHIILGHEMVHGFRDMNGIAKYNGLYSYYMYKDERGQTYRKTCQTDELETVGIMGNSAYSENKIRKEQGINSRIRY